MKKIPMRPDDPDAKKGLTADEMDCLTYYVISGCRKEDAFKRFAAQDFIKTRVALQFESRKLFASEYAKKYIVAYEKTLDEFIRGANEFTKDITDDGEVRIVLKERITTDSEEVFKKRKAVAIKNFTDYVFGQSENIGTMDDPESLVKIADKMGLFDNLEDNIEPPRRYLPEICSRSCRYRLFCEGNMVNGNIVDECVYCKYKTYANKNGVVYDNTDMLDIPSEQVTSNLKSADTQ